MERLTNTKNKGRLEYIDKVSGLLIIYMIFYHILQWSGYDEIIKSYWMTPLSFFMAWFFFKSGMFNKRRTVNGILSGGGKLIIPYVVFSIVGHFIYSIYLIMNNDWNLMHYTFLSIKQLLLTGSIAGNMPLWFLISLLVVQLLYSYISSKVKDWLLIPICFSTAYLLNTINIQIPLYIESVMLGLAFYSLGHYFADKQKNHIIVFLAIITYFIILIVIPSSIDFRKNEVTLGYYSTAVLFAISGCILINNLFNKFTCKYDLLSYIGKRSMAFYVLHWIVLRLCKLSMSVFETFDSISFIIFAIISCIIILPIITESLINSKYKFVLGIK